MRYLALKAGGHAYEAFMVLGKHFLIDPGPVIKTFEIPDADQFDQVAVAFHIFT
jgi:hypothetical protein